MSATVVRQKPLMTMPQILLMNLGFFGVQYSFGMQQRSEEHTSELQSR